MKRALQTGLLLLAGALGKTAWDVVVAPRPAAAAVLMPAPLAAPVQVVPAQKLGAAAKPRAKARTPKSVQPALAPLPLPPMVATEPAPTPVEAAVQEPAPAPVPVPAEEPIAFDGNGADIARAIAKAKRAAVQQCFEHELKRSPDLAGTVTIELDLAPPRQVQSVRVSDDLQRPEFTACVTAAMQQLSFTGLNEEVSVQLPYVLSARRK